ncbi:MAG: DUF2189 domain-containing protein [Rhodobacteraceae bacterium]|nr:DUF2189 domain-containing protein [Paracoccaceae bacterium]
MIDTERDATPMPEINIVEFSDLKEILAKGWRDYKQAPIFGIVFGLVFALGGMVIYLQLMVWGEGWGIFSVIVGFPLISPFLAVGLYEVSREIERGETPTWQHVLNGILRERSREIPWMAFVSVFFFGMWTYLAHLIFALFFGLKPMTNVMSSNSILFTTDGLVFLAVGTIAGAVIATVLFSITVVSIPLLLHREVDFITAMITSVNFVLNNKMVMFVWGIIVTVLTLLAMLPFFLGLLIILPVLGHATWHLYRIAVD